MTAGKTVFVKAVPVHALRAVGGGLGPVKDNWWSICCGGVVFKAGRKGEWIAFKCKGWSQRPLEIQERGGIYDNEEELVMRLFRLKSGGQSRGSYQSLVSALLPLIPSFPLSLSYEEDRKPKERKRKSRERIAGNGTSSFHRAFSR